MGGDEDFNHCYWRSRLPAPIKVNSVYGLFYLSADLVYVLFFPALLCSIYIKYVNTVGVVGGYITGIILRFLSGEDLLSFPPIIKFPLYDEEAGKQYFPFKTLIMLINLSITVFLSFVYHKWSQMRGKKNDSYDAKEGEGERMIQMQGKQIIN